MGDANRIAGTPQNGQVSYTMTIPYLAEQGTGTVRGINLYDQVGNLRELFGTQVAALGFPTTFMYGP